MLGAGSRSNHQGRAGSHPVARAASWSKDLAILRLCIKNALTMAFAVLLVLAGLALCVYGVVLATRMRRPLDLLGALLAAGGLAIAMLGTGRLLSERFFSG